MPLDHATQAWLAAVPPFDPSLPLTVLRAATDAGLIAQQIAAEDALRYREFTVAAADNYPLPVRMYVPAGQENQTERPALVYAHGGGWCLGSLDAWNTPCRQLADATGCVLFSVDYRLAPEHQFPVPLTDFYAVLCAIAAQATAFGIDAERIAVGGDSAGGNIAAAACLLAREQQGPHIAHQLLLYPALDAAMDTPSYQQYATGYGLTRDLMAWCWQKYLPDAADRGNMLVSPLAAASLHGLPDTTLLVCEYDPLRSEGEQYARRLQQAGVRVRSELLTGTVHGALHMTRITPAAQQLFKHSALFC